jgi:hypothetical protein
MIKKLGMYFLLASIAITLIMVIVHAYNLLGPMNERNSCSIKRLEACSVVRLCRTVSITNSL